MKVIIDADVLLYQALPRDPHSAFTFAVENYNRIKDNVIGNCFGTDVITCFSLPGKNFRKQDYASYKADRQMREPPEHLFDLKDWALENDPHAEGSQFGEADDLVLTTAADCLETGEPFVIASVDKDLKTIGPAPYYNMRQRTIEKVTPEDAIQFIFEQMLAGDPGDHIPGLYRVGYKTAGKLLSEYKTNEEKYYATKSIWKEKRPEDWKEGFNDTTNLTLIRRREEDLKPLDFSEMDYGSFKDLLRFCVPD